MVTIPRGTETRRERSRARSSVSRIHVSWDHALVLDGVFDQTGDTVRFHPGPPFDVANGFDLHVGVCVPADQRDRLERIASYRPALRSSTDSKCPVWCLTLWGHGPAGRPQGDHDRRLTMRAGWATRSELRPSTDG